MSIFELVLCLFDLAFSVVCKRLFREFVYVELRVAELPHVGVFSLKAVEHCKCLLLV